MTPVSGGLIHRMWRLDTSQGSFAVKELDSAIMARPGVHADYVQSEKIAAALQSKGIPVATALLQNETPLFETEGAIVMVFPWVDGGSLMVDAVTVAHANQIGEILAKIHAANLNDFDLPVPEGHLILQERWHALIDEAIKEDLPWALDAQTNLANLVAWSDAANQAKQRLSTHLIIGHKDIDPKNVLWRDEYSPVIIDWEGVGLINPTEEIINVAIEWAGMPALLCRDDVFSAVIAGYCNAGSCIIDSEVGDALFSMMGGCLGWLEFNMYRSLALSGYDFETKRLGIRETELTFKKLHFLANHREHFIKLMNSKGNGKTH